MFYFSLIYKFNWSVQFDTFGINAMLALFICKSWLQRKRLGSCLNTLKELLVLFSSRLFLLHVVNALHFFSSTLQ
jgi:hypothetical protein